MSVTAEATAIRPFRIDIPEEQLAELRRRIAATRWPSAEADGSDVRPVATTTSGFFNNPDWGAPRP